ncbi:regulator of G protein signaling domain protein, partial [Ostertagia ostertagi]
ENVRRVSNGADKISFVTDHLPLQPDNEVNPLTAGGAEQIVIQNSCVLAQNIDHLLADSSALTFFIQFLECYDKLRPCQGSGYTSRASRHPWERRGQSVHKMLKTLLLFSTLAIYSADISIRILHAAYLFLRRFLNGYLLGYQSGRFLQTFLMKRKALCTACLTYGWLYFKDFENSLFYKKYQLQVFSRRCSLDDILYIPALLNAFLEFVDDRHDHDCLQFLIACNAFEENYDSLSDEEALEDAMSIYDKYFSMQALSPIQIGDTARRRMESEICSDSGRPLLSSFITAKQYCFLRIHDRYLENFVKSTAYHNFLSELEAEVRNMIELPRPNREMKCGSSSSDSQAVLLDHHFDIPEFKRVSSGSSQHSPLLIRRNRSLNLAEVDCMGQYRVLYDDSLAQDTTTPSKIRQKLRKYLDKSTLKEEEVALEVARTIIADVHSMVEAGKR